jgi:hypothetical protein
MKSQLLLLLVIIITGQSVYAGAQEDLFTAALACDLSGVQKAIDGGADANAINPENGQNALAASFFCVDVTKLLLEKGCDPDGGSYPAIISAANCYSVEVLKILLEGGADANAIGVIEGGAHLLKLAEAEKAKGKKGNKDMIKAWESAAASIPRTEVNALQQTVQQTNCVPCLELLLKHGADVSKNEIDGGLMHTLASFSMTPEMRKEGFTKGAPYMETLGLKVPDFYGNLPDDINGTPGQMLDHLAKAGLDVNGKRADGISAFMVAMRNHKLDLCKSMLRNGADAVSITEMKFGKRVMTTYPICAAAEFADMEMMQMILDQEPDMNVSVETAALGVTTNSDYKGNTNWGGDGYTALIISIMSGKTDVANLLLDNDASIKIGSSGISIIPTKFVIIQCLTTIKNKTPIYWAVEQEDLALVERIAVMMNWKFNPDFTIKQYGGSNEGFGGFSCAKFKKKQSPSIYATTVGNMKAAGLLMGKGL